MFTSINTFNININSILPWYLHLLLIYTLQNAEQFHRFLMHLMMEPEA